MAHLVYYLCVDNITSGSLILGAYDDLTKMEHDNDGFFKSLLSNDIGFFLIIKIYDHNPTPNTDTSYSFELLGYPCCTDLNTPVATTDSDSKWGIENNKWCGIADSSIPIVPSVNILSIQYNVYTNKCIHSDRIKKMLKSHCKKL